MISIQKTGNDLRQTSFNKLRVVIARYASSGQKAKETKVRLTQINN